MSSIHTSCACVFVMSVALGGYREAGCYVPRRRLQTVRIDACPSCCSARIFASSPAPRWPCEKLGKRLRSDFVFNRPSSIRSKARLLFARTDSGAHGDRLPRRLACHILRSSRSPGNEACFRRCTPIWSRAFLRSSACISTIGPDATEHFRLVSGYDAKPRGRPITIRRSPTGADHRIQPSLSQLLAAQVWNLCLTVVRFRLDRASNRLELRAASESSIRRICDLRADYAQHISRSTINCPRKKGYVTVVDQPPFVVIGDESAVRGFAAAPRTPSNCRRSRKAILFPARSQRIFDIWSSKTSQPTRKTQR